MAIDPVLARLIAQAAAQGGDIVTCQAIAEEASASGAERALARLGLADEKARSDIGELRELLSAWRDAKRTARNEVVGWMIRIILALLLLGLAARLGLVALVKA